MPGDLDADLFLITLIKLIIHTI